MKDMTRSEAARAIREVVGRKPAISIERNIAEMNDWQVCVQFTGAGLYSECRGSLREAVFDTLRALKAIK